MTDVLTFIHLKYQFTYNWLSTIFISLKLSVIDRQMLWRVADVIDVLIHFLRTGRPGRINEPFFRWLKIKITTYPCVRSRLVLPTPMCHYYSFFPARIRVVLDFLVCRPCTFINPRWVAVYSLTSRFQTVIIMYTSCVKMYYTI